MEAALSQDKESPSGHVRVATPVSLGLMLTSRLPFLMARYPALSVELIMEDHFGDMIEERLDIAIRSGEITNMSLIKRNLGNVVRVAVAAPSYLQLHGFPLLPGDLAAHDCIVHRTTPNAAEWRFVGPTGPETINVRGQVSTNNHEAVRTAVLGGLGISLLPEYMVVDDVAAGRLHRVLPDYTSEKLPAYLVYPSRRHLPGRTRVVIDFLIDEVRQIRARRTEEVVPVVALPDVATRSGGTVTFAS
jgi:DNA-binding transcriptional LysR family regulator